MKIICIGRNYAKHIEELANERPTNPVVFMKPDSAILPKRNPFFIPPFSNDVHHEVEILVKINKVGKHIQEKFAHKYYDEIGLGIDFTARDVQSKCKEKGLPWEKAKAFDGSAVIGEFYPKSEFDLKEIKFQLLKNDAIVQDGNSTAMLWKIDELIGAHFLSEGKMLGCNTCCVSTQAETVETAPAVREVEPPEPAKIEEPTAAPEPVLPAETSFEISIEKGPGDVVGLDVDWGDTTKLRVTKIKAGLVSTWNSNNPDSQVQVGDYLTAINGKSGNSKELLQVVKDNSKLNITIFRTG